MDAEAIEAFEKLLYHWGTWKRHYIRGLGHKSTTVEYMLMRTKGWALGDGNKGGGYNPETINSVHFTEDPEAERIERARVLLEDKFKEEVAIIELYYSHGWTLRKLSKKLHRSRYEMRNRLAKARNLLYIQVLTLPPAMDNPPGVL